MVFSTYIFLLWYLTAFLVAYYALPRSWRPGVIVVASYLFYGWWRAEYCVLLAVSTVLNFWCGRRIAHNEDERKRKFWVTISVVGSLGLLAYFKYAGMLTVWADNVGRLFVDPPAGDTVVPVLNVVLPIGISFFTFQAISYSIDIYRKNAEEAESLLRFAGYISMFPQLIAGPIVRYNWIAKELNERNHSPAKFAMGLHFFAIGLFKKVLVADLFALAVPAAFGVHQPTPAEAWIGVVGYTLQIYFDFSAYSDMAVGLGLLMGFTFPQNFDSPYKSASITEFWRRWHISLSTWLRDYLYLPLGGNRKGRRRTYFNLMMVMLLGGLWHGASILFVLWGLWHGVLLALERALGPRHPLARLPKPFAILVTLLLAMIGWVLFRSEDVGMAARILAAMVGLAGIGEHNPQVNLHPVVIALLPVGIAACWFLKNSFEIRWRQSPLQVVQATVLLSLAITVVLAYPQSPFLYFQF